MFVIMDMEWIENAQGVPCPTQIAAMRVDEKWECIDSYDSLIRPRSDSRAPWNHIAFTGVDPWRSINARPEAEVFRDLFRWMKEDDVCLWWADIPEKMFQTVMEKNLHHVLPQQSKCLLPAVTALCAENGNAYKLARGRGIAVPLLPHVSTNDVEAIRALLQGIAFDPINLDSPSIGKGKGKGRKHRKEAIQYYYDPDEDMLHSAKCECLKPNASVVSYGKLKNCIKKGLRPCPVCCKEEYYRESQKLTKDTITRAHFNFVYRTKSEVFHTAECVHTRRMPFWDIKGTVYYQSCIAQGKRPCKICKPAPIPGKQKIVEIGTKTISQQQTIISDEDSFATLDALCEAHGYKHRFCVNVYYIRTPVGKWRLDTSTDPIKLWHVNLLKCRGQDDQYHRQPVDLRTLTQVFRYIHKHDSRLLNHGGIAIGF